MTSWPTHLPSPAAAFFAFRYERHSCSSLFWAYFWDGPDRSSMPRKQYAVVRQIEEHGGIVDYDFFHGSDKLRRPTTFADDISHEVVGINCLGSELPDKALQGIGVLKHLTDLCLRETKVTSSGINMLRGLDALEMLDALDTSIDDSGMEAISTLGSLKYLNLDRTLVGDAGLPWIARLSKLEYLDLGNTRVTAEGLLQLRGLSNLKDLKIYHIKLTPARQQALSAALHNCHVECWTVLSDDSPR